MKHLLTFLVLLLSMTGCDSSADEDDTSLALGTVTARIDGERFEARFVVATTASAGTSRNFLLSSAESDGTAIAFVLYPFDGEGRYPFGSAQRTPSNGVVSIDGRSHSTALNGGGTVEITDLAADEVRGTFHFTATDAQGEAVEVTEGRFFVPLTNSGPPLTDAGAMSGQRTGALSAVAEAARR